MTAADERAGIFGDDGIFRELSDAQYVALGVLPMSKFPAEHRARINSEACGDRPPEKLTPPRWMAPMARTHSRGWFEWHIRRGRDPRKKRESIAPWLRKSVIERHGMVCGICLNPIADTSDLHIDHVIPLSRGGATNISNLQPAHALCNMRKGAKQ